MTMENKEETQNAVQATVLQDGKTAIAGNDSSEDPDNDVMMKAEQVPYSIPPPGSPADSAAELAFSLKHVTTQY